MQPPRFQLSLTLGSRYKKMNRTIKIYKKDIYFHIFNVLIFYISVFIGRDDYQISYVFISAFTILFVFATIFILKNSKIILSGTTITIGSKVYDVRDNEGSKLSILKNHYIKNGKKIGINIGLLGRESIDTIRNFIKINQLKSAQQVD